MKCVNEMNGKLFTVFSIREAFDYKLFVCSLRLLKKSTIYIQIRKIRVTPFV